MKAVQLLVNSKLPKELRDYSRNLDSKGIGELMRRVASDYPDKYEDIVQHISDIGRNASYEQGETISLKDFQPVFDRDAVLKRMDRDITMARARFKDDEEFHNEREKIWGKYTAEIEREVARNGIAKGNNLAYSIVSGARGKPAQLKAMQATPGIYQDSRGKTIPMFVRHSLAEGLRPAEYAAGFFGARQSVISTKRCLRKGTLVRMADFSLRPIEAIKIGDYVMGADTCGNVFPVRVNRTYNQGIQEVWRHHFTFGRSDREIVFEDMTKEHKVLVRSARPYEAAWNKYRRGTGPKPDASQYRVNIIDPAGCMCFRNGKSISSPILPAGGFSGTKKEPWSLLLGLLIGDGCLRKSHEICLSCADISLIHDIENYVAELGCKLRKNRTSNHDWNLTWASYNPILNGSVRKGKQGFVKGTYGPLASLIKSYGLCGKYSWEKVFPVGWESWDKESLARLIAGIFASGGSIFSTVQTSGRAQVSISFGLTSSKLVEAIQACLSLVFGINGVIERPVTTGGFESSTSSRTRPLYSFSVGRLNDVLKFRDLIGPHVPGVKRRKMYEITEGLSLKPSSDYATLSFHRREYVGWEPCYDLEVEHEDHLFVLGSGMIVSNSTAKGGDLSKQLAQTGANLVVTSNDCKSHNGRLLSVDDSSMRGRVLAQDTGPYKAGTLISKGVLEDIKRDTNIKELVVRSPMTCDNKDGICAKCAGAYWNGRRFPRVGDAIGITAANAIGEPITQMALNCIEKGTPVAMEDGTWMPIEELEIGDRVKTADVDGNVHVSSVTHVFDQGVQKVWDWIFHRPGVGSKTIPATDDHKVLLRDTKTQKTAKLPLKKATRTHEIVTSCQDEHFSFYKKVRGREVHCYDIEVDCPSHLFILANGSVVSNSKHTGGITGAKKEYSGFEVINQLVQSPEQFPDRATVAEEDGTVTNIIDAPQGGKYVIVGQKKNYVPHGYPVTVSIGDTVEAGDALSEGIVDPGDVVKYKGLGQGRLYWADRLKDALDASGMQAMRINTEILARNAIDHVEVDDPEGAGDALPGDVVSYNKLRWTYKPDEELVQAKLPSQAVGKYLQEPVLHYSIGTRITPQVLKRLSTAKLDARPYAVSEQPPGFTADMQRLRTASHVNDDFLASMSTSYLSSQLNHAATRGLETDLKSNVHYAPRLAYGEGFGEETRTTGKF